MTRHLRPRQPRQRRTHRPAELRRRSRARRASWLTAANRGNTARILATRNATPAFRGRSPTATTPGRAMRARRGNLASSTAWIVAVRAKVLAARLVRFATAAAARRLGIAPTARRGASPAGRRASARPVAFARQVNSCNAVRCCRAARRARAGNSTQTRRSQRTAASDVHRASPSTAGASSAQDVAQCSRVTARRV